MFWIPLLLLLVAGRRLYGDETKGQAGGAVATVIENTFLRWDFL